MESDMLRSRRDGIPHRHHHMFTDKKCSWNKYGRIACYISYSSGFWLNVTMVGRLSHFRQPTQSPQIQVHRVILSLMDSMFC